MEENQAQYYQLNSRRNLSFGGPTGVGNQNERYATNLLQKSQEDV